MTNAIEVTPFKTITKSGERYKLYIEGGYLLRNTPSWSTENGAKRWAVKNGYTIAPPASSKYPARKKTAYIITYNDHFTLLMNGRYFEFKTRNRAIEYAKGLFPDITIIDNTGGA